MSSLPIVVSLQGGYAGFVWLDYPIHVLVSNDPESILDSHYKDLGVVHYRDLAESFVERGQVTPGHSLEDYRELPLLQAMVDWTRNGTRKPGPIVLVLPGTGYDPVDTWRKVIAALNFTVRFAFATTSVSIHAGEQVYSIRDRYNPIGERKPDASLGPWTYDPERETPWSREEKDELPGRRIAPMPVGSSN